MFYYRMSFMLKEFVNNLLSGKKVTSSGFTISEPGTSHEVFIQEVKHVNKFGGGHVESTMFSDDTEDTLARIYANPPGDGVECTMNGQRVPDDYFKANRRKQGEKR